MRISIVNILLIEINVVVTPFFRFSAILLPGEFRVRANSGENSSPWSSEMQVTIPEK